MNTYGLHVIKCPTGVYVYVGSIPLELCKARKPNIEDIMAGRVIGGRVYYSPLFDTRDEAEGYARVKGFEVLVP